MTDKPTPTTDLLKRCAEIHEWRSTGLLSGEALRDYAKRKWPDRHDTLQMAEHETVTEALALLATGGEPAGTVGYTVHGTQYVNWRTKPPAHGTPIYTTPQPTQAQAGAVRLDEARRLFDAGWKAAALFCDREDVVADGIIGFGACPQFEAAFSAAQPVAREPLPKFLALKFHARRDKKATVTLLFPGHEAADAWVRGIKGGQHGTE